MVNVSKLIEHIGLDGHVHLRQSQSDRVDIMALLDEPLMKSAFHSLIQFFGTFITQQAHESYAADITITPSLTGGISIELKFSHLGPPIDAVLDLFERERLGLQAYLAFHHHGGTISIKNWGEDQGLVVVHIPVSPPAKQPAATAAQQPELLNKFSSSI
jgi:hypothetical protein